jgi:DNA-binding Lrp family transcriptional regulator
VAVNQVNLHQIETTRLVQRVKIAPEREGAGGERMTKNIEAYLLCVTQVGLEHQVAETLQSMEGVVSAEVVYGEFDIVTTIEAPDLRSLDAAITKLRQVTGIVRTMTLIAG